MGLSPAGITLPSLHAPVRHDPTARGRRLHAFRRPVRMRSAQAHIFHALPDDPGQSGCDMERHSAPARLYRLRPAAHARGRPADVPVHMDRKAPDELPGLMAADTPGGMGRPLQGLKPQRKKPPPLSRRGPSLWRPHVNPARAVENPREVPRCRRGVRAAYGGRRGAGPGDPEARTISAPRLKGASLRQRSN